MYAPTRARFLIPFLALILVSGAAPARAQQSPPPTQPASTQSQPAQPTPPTQSKPVRPAPPAYTLPPALLAKAITLTHKLPVIYTAATDGTDQLRYTVGEDAKHLAAQRDSQDDATFFEEMHTLFRP